MSYNDLLHNLGFIRDPFAKTNADEEELLEDYLLSRPSSRRSTVTLMSPRPLSFTPPAAVVRQR
jgi:hypothetical protein